MYSFAVRPFEGLLVPLPLVYCPCHSSKSIPLCVCSCASEDRLRGVAVGAGGQAREGDRTGPARIHRSLYPLVDLASSAA